MKGEGWPRKAQLICEPDTCVVWVFENLSLNSQKINRDIKMVLSLSQKNAGGGRMIVLGLEKYSSHSCTAANLLNPRSHFNLRGLEMASDVTHWPRKPSTWHIEAGGSWVGLLKTALNSPPESQWHKDCRHSFQPASWEPLSHIPEGMRWAWARQPC